jgi:hypothetical protein
VRSSWLMILRTGWAGSPASRAAAAITTHREAAAIFEETGDRDDEAVALRGIRRLRRERLVVLSVPGVAADGCRRGLHETGDVTGSTYLVAHRGIDAEQHVQQRPDCGGDAGPAEDG